MPEDQHAEVCEYHLERKGVASASRSVNGDWMCSRCFAGAAIFSFEKIGDTDGDASPARPKNGISRRIKGRETAKNCATRSFASSAGR